MRKIINAGIEFDHADHPDCLCHVKYFHFDRLDGLDFYTLPQIKLLKNHILDRNTNLL